MLGIEDTVNLHTKFSNAYFEALGYKLIKIHMQNYEIDEEEFVKRIKFLIEKKK